ncbi:Gfo/Idh/MocA family protein [Heyndrickxia sp. NPDC080065]|uniref:Gfo/Idh/MocA family protein n=1 Tax=Heyndrickxia sp. NPDC080065 TaxID=3390568 RepID=UPI003CFEA3AA
MNKFKVGIIGTGFGAKVHAPMMNFHDGFDVVAIASVSRGNVENVKQSSGVNNVYTDWRKMLDQEQLDFVVIASAVHMHKEMTFAAFKKGIHVLGEKPMALHISETEEMISARDDAGKFGLINHEFRFLPARTKVKEILESGKMGEIMHVRYEYTFSGYTSLISNSRGWLGQKETGGGMLGAIGSHMVDSLHWWLDSELKEVFANLSTHVPVFTDDQGNVEHRTADDAFQIIGTLKNGATVTLEFLSSARQADNDCKLEIFGKNGTLVMLNDSKVLFSSEDSPLKEVELAPDITAPEGMPVIAARYYNGFNRMLDALHETFSTEKKHPYLADFENGRVTQKVLDAVRLSAKEGKKIKIN